jgi:hypothetical protein
MLDEYRKTPASNSDISSAIAAEVKNRTSNYTTISKTDLDTITQQATSDVLQSLASSSAQQKFTNASAGYSATINKINKLTLESNKLKKLINSNTTSSASKIKLYDYPSAVNQNKYRLSELNDILDRLKKNNAPYTQISDVINKINELSNKY